MKTKKISKKLRLDKETITNLSSQEKMRILGGHTMVCTGMTLCDTFCNASMYTECIYTCIYTNFECDPE